MCGILGYVSEYRSISENSFEKMVQSLASRGPDGQSVKYFSKNHIALGHRRLAIIDLSNAATQPMTNEDGSVWLTFNGEIYNYRELRQTLEKRGHIFRSHSDSETIIHAYEEWGEKCLNYLQGIFAFGIYNCQDSSLFIARDHFGVKPLYYYSHSDRFIFASQPKAIIVSDDFKVEIDRDAFSLYLGYGNIPAEHCIYKGIQKLLPGHFLWLKKGKISVKQYWKVQYKPEINNVFEAVEAVQNKISDCIDSQSISDVPIGTLLSGGVDSTIVTSLLSNKFSQQISSFSIGFLEEESDESQYARLVARVLQTKHNERLLTYDYACDLLPDIVEAFDEPFHFNGLFPFYALSRLVQSQNIKVVFGGDGADEIFAGYLWYEHFIKESELNTNTSLPPFLKRFIKNNTFFKSTNPVKNFFGYNGFFRPIEQNNILGSEVRSLDDREFYKPLNKHWNSQLPKVLGAQFLDINCFLVDHCLTKVDRASMACGVEVRVPFLDLELVKLIFSIDHNLIFFNNERKTLLKKAMHKTLPSQMNTHRKKGFSSPLSKWLERGLAKAGYSLLLDGSLCKYGLLNPTFIKEFFPFLNSNKQLLLISAELWFKRWINNDLNAVKEFSEKSIMYQNSIKT